MRTAPMRQPTARRKLLPVAENSSGVIARPVCVVVANAGAYDGSIVSRPVVVRIWITIIVVRVRPVIARRIITCVVCYIRALCTSSQKSCHQPCAKDRQQHWSATLGFYSRFHEISPFSILVSLLLLVAETADQQGVPLYDSNPESRLVAGVVKLAGPCGLLREAVVGKRTAVTGCNENHTATLAPLGANRSW